MQQASRRTGQAHMQGDAGQPGTCKWQSLDRKKCGDDSPTTTRSGVLQPVRVRALQEGRHESTGRYAIARRGGRSRTRSAQQNA